MKKEIVVVFRYGIFGIKSIRTSEHVWRKVAFPLRCVGVCELDRLRFAVYVERSLFRGAIIVLFVAV